MEREGNKREYIGLVANKETLAGDLEDGKRVYLQVLSVFDAAPKEERHKPDYWATHCDTGEFANRICLHHLSCVKTMKTLFIVM